MARKHEAKLAALSGSDAADVAETMQALATASRVRILGRLAAGPCSVKDLAKATELKQPAVSQQLRVLREVGLVSGKASGRKTIYRLRDKHVGVLLAEAVAHAEQKRDGDDG